MITLHHVVKRMNVIKPLADHLIGEHHHPVTRMGIGFTVAVVGTAIVKVHWEVHLFALVVESVGCLIQAIGIIPFIESLFGLVGAGESAVAKAGFEHFTDTQ